MADDQYAVMVRKHEHEPKEEIKFLGATQYKYGKKNWSSVMLFNNEKCQKLTPAYVMGKMESNEGLALHQFNWCEEFEVGSLPKNWNFLVGSEELNETPYLIHYTEGTPCFKDYKDCELADVWHDTKAEMLHSES